MKCCYVVIENSVFFKNFVIYGGGFFLVDENLVLGNDFIVINLNFSCNYVG